MISYAFVNSSFEPIYSVEQGGHIVNECKNICNDIINDIDHFSSYYENVMFESEIFGMSDENVVMLESEKKNIFAKIGEKIITIFNKFKTMLQGLIDKLKGNDLSKKSDIDKLETMIKEHPDLKEKIIENSKDFDFSEIRTMSEMDEYYKKLLSVENPSKKKELYDKMCKIATGAVTVAAGATTIIKLGDVVNKLSKSNNEMLAKAQDKYVSLGKDLNSVNKQIADLQKVPKGETMKRLTPQETEYLASLRITMQAITRNMEYTQESINRYQSKSNTLLRRAISNANDFIHRRSRS